MPIDESFTKPSTIVAQFEEIRFIVESEFDIEEGYIDRGIPTFYVKLKGDSKRAFLKIARQMEARGFMAVLRRRDEKVVLRAVPKPSVKPSRKIINIGLFLATLGTVFISGYYFLFNDIFGALMFTGAIIAILSSHEMAHKLIANKHGIKATYPYFIPGPPPIGTFGAIIQQKSLPPNRDALFDIGAMGPIAGFVMAVIATIIGLPFSTYTWIHRSEPSGMLPLLAQLLGLFLLPPLEIAPPYPGPGYILAIKLHPVSFAGWVGMVITMLNLVPVGMFDGGHVARSLFSKRTHQILSYLGIILLILIWYPMAFLALFFSFYRHPGPLDDVSPPTTRRKLAALGLIAIFILCVVPIYPLLR